MNAYRMLLIQPLLERRLSNEVWSTVLLMVLAFAEYVSTLVWPQPRGLASFLAGVFCAVAVLIWWGVFLQNVVQQNRPSLATLVPGLRRKLMVLTAAVWAGGSLLPALLVGALLGHFGYVLVGTAFLLLFVALCQRHVMISFVVTLISVVGLQVYREQLIKLLDLVTAWGEAGAAAAAIMLMAPLGWLALHMLFPRGGDRHFAWGDVAARRACNVKRGMVGIGLDSTAGLSLLRLLDTVYRSRLGASVRDRYRMFDGLGPRLHWSRPVLAIVAATALLLALDALAGERNPRPLVPIAFVLLVLPLWAYVRSALAALKETPVEQGILLLAPAAPPRRDLNRKLARVLLARYAIAWLMYLGCTALIVTATIGSWKAWVCCAAAGLTFAIPLLRDHARHPGWNSALLVFGAVMLLAPSVAGVVEYLPVPAGLLAGAVAATVVGTCVALRLRWQAAVAAAPAFPAGRLAG